MNFLITSGCRAVPLPLDDKAIAEYFADTANSVSHLLYEINVCRTYDFLFRGKSHLTFLDLGANIGLVSAYAQDACDRVVAVEPAPKTFSMLERMAMHFGRIQPMRLAIAEKSGEAVFHVNDINTTASSIINTYGTEITVPTMTVRDLMNAAGLGNIDVCKVDIEGSEDKSLSAEQLELCKGFIRSYYIETHNCPETTWQHKLGALVERLMVAGYGHMRIEGMALYAERL